MPLRQPPVTTGVPCFVRPSETGSGTLGGEALLRWWASSRLVTRSLRRPVNRAGCLLDRADPRAQTSPESCGPHVKRRRGNVPRRLEPHAHSGRFSPASTCPRCGRAIRSSVNFVSVVRSHEARSCRQLVTAEPLGAAICTALTARGLCCVALYNALRVSCAPIQAQDHQCESAQVHARHSVTSLRDSFTRSLGGGRVCYAPNRSFYAWKIQVAWVLQVTQTSWRHRKRIGLLRSKS